MRPGQTGDARASTPIRSATSAAMSPASSRDRAPRSRCCRPRTPPATTSRSSSACRSRSSSTIRRPMSRSGPACRSMPTVRVDPTPSLFERLRALAMSAARPTWRRRRGGRAVANPWLIARAWSRSPTFMEVLDTTIANVALPYIAGGLGVSEDEASWVVTTYLVANAVILDGEQLPRQAVRPQGASSSSASALFTVSSVLCGFAGTSRSLLLFRVLQGFGGGGMVPVAQSILADSFPPEKRGQAFALFGVAVVVAPVVGPTLGGWLSDNWSWHWCFLINGPVGVMRDGADHRPVARAATQASNANGAGGRPLRSRSASCWSRPSSARSKSCSTAASRTTGSPRPSSSRSRRHLRAGVRADDSLGADAPQPDDRHADAGDAVSSAPASW